MSDEQNFSGLLREKQEEAESVIFSFLPEETGYTKRLAEAMNYSMRAGGKRLRPILMKEAYLMFGGTGDIIQPFMAAMEMIHTSSLIHDDLPAIDNDEYRRGKRTTHVVFGENVGILAGDALLNYAYETASTAFLKEAGNPAVGQAFLVLTKKTGIGGMLGGQSVDVMNDGRPLAGGLLDFIYEYKTAALIEASLMIGAILADAPAQAVTDMETIGRNAGLAFQIRDDMLDVISTTEELGKPVNSDEKNQKTTYVTTRGLDGAAREVERLSGEAIALLDSYPQEHTFLRELLQALVNRKT